MLNTLAVAGLSASLSAAQFPFVADINGALDHGVNTGSGISTFSTSNPNQGFIGDGGYDALDGYGYLSNLGSLTVQRQVDFFAAQNTYRWLDVYTNPTASAITRTITFRGDMGSDAATTIRASQPGLLVTSDAGSNGNSPTTTDPVLAHVAGLTSFSGGSITQSIVNDNTFGNWADDYHLDITLTLAPGESAGILSFLSLVRVQGPRNGSAFANDISLADATGQNLLTNPILTGLSAAQVASIRNFGAPEPATIALLLLGCGGLGFALHRRRQAA